ncbi:mucin-13 [Chiroxiphia lanceolata]|uniref:mucin-13 n=1 Tax=Chiroxiphia lanceolata TaxID=296741 RepID=UPI0013CE54E6|nr:mucin-13 [Chiroxiphia lanceolata]
MRRRVFLAVLLSLVLGLLKETTAASEGEESTTVPTTSKTLGSENETEATTAPSVNTTTDTTGSENETEATTAPSVNTTTDTTGSGNETEATTAPSVNTTTDTTGSGNETEATTAPSVNTTTNTTGSENETEATTAPSVNTTTDTTGSGNETEATTAPSVNTTTDTTGSGNETEATTAPSVNTTTDTTGSENETEATTAPSVNTTTDTTGSGNETEATTAPSVNTTTDTTGSGNETEATTAPSVNTTTNTTGSENETEATTAPSVNTTTDTTGSGNETEATTAPSVNTTTDTTENFCSSDPCGRNFAKCVSLKSNYTCQCDYGFYYSKEDKNCYRGDVYPGVISVNQNSNDSVKIVNSTAYEEVFNGVSEFFERAFKNLSTYVQTVIVEIQPSEKSRAASQTIVTVMNLFKENSSVTNETVSHAVEQAIEENSSYVSSYKEAKKCDVFQCDNQTTVCVEDLFPECQCKSGLEKTTWDDRSCSACSKDCSAQAHKYCAIEGGIPKCTCMTNFEDKDGNDGECVPCQVGYSGENCTDNTELILIIVGTILGAIILSLVITVSVISARAKHKQNPEKKKLIKSGYSDTDISDDRPTITFPRVQTTSGHANPGYQPNNPYEMPSTNKGHFLERDYDDLYEPSRERGGFRMQSRY